MDDPRPSLTAVRARIDEIDVSLLALVDERAQLAAAVAAAKRAEAPVEPTGSDDTFWVTDAPDTADTIIEALGHDGVAACQVQAAGGLRLFKLAGFYQPSDARLARAPGRLSGVIGAAPTPLDL